MMWRMLGVLAALALVGCEDNSTWPGDLDEVRSAVVVVNPRTNQGSTTPVTPSAWREGIELKATDLPAVRTDAQGLAVVKELPSGPVTLDFGPGTYSFEVSQNVPDLYDVVLTYRHGTVREVVPPVRYFSERYARGLGPGAELGMWMLGDLKTLMLQPGHYQGNFTWDDEDLVLLGAWSPEEGPLSIIDGDVTLLGNRNRLRGVKINGRLTTKGDQVSVAFSDLASATFEGDDVLLLRNHFTQGPPTVSGSNAVLLDNTGMP